MLLKTKELYLFWISVHKDFPRVERLSLGTRIDTTFLNVLEYIFSCIFLPPITKIQQISKTISELDKLGFFIQIAWENEIIKTNNYEKLSKGIAEICRQLGAWKKGLLSKTSAP